MAELQENVSSSLKLQTDEDVNDAATVEQVADGELESPQDKLRSAALQKLEGAGQDTALGHVCLWSSFTILLSMCFFT